MRKKLAYPKVNRVDFIYSGDAEKFDKFVNGMIHDYLNSEKSDDYFPYDFVESVDCFENNF